jgi:hypothetical protein
MFHVRKDETVRQIPSADGLFLLCPWQAFLQIPYEEISEIAEFP